MNYSKRQALWFSAVFMAVVLYPIMENWSKNPKDNFPLSYYPMFSKKRPSTYGLTYVVGMDTLGNAFRVPYKLIGEGGFNQVRRQTARAYKKEQGLPFLQTVAAKIKARSPKRFEGLTTLQLVKGYYHLESYFLEHDTLPKLERVISTLKLPQDE